MVTQIQHTSSSDKSYPVTSDVDTHLSYPLALSLCVFLCQGLSIARSSRRVTWHRAVSITHRSPQRDTRAYTHIQPEGTFRCFRPVTEGVRGLHSPPADRPLSCIVTRLLTCTHTDTRGHSGPHSNAKTEIYSVRSPYVRRNRH